MPRTLKQQVGSFLFSIESGSGMVPFLERRRLISLYVIGLVTLIGGTFNIALVAHQGHPLSVILQSSFSVLVYLSIILFWIFRNFSISLYLVFSAILILMADIIIAGGGEAGLGVFYILPAFPAIYFLFGARKALFLELLFFFGFTLRILLGKIPETSFYSDPSIVPRVILVMLIAVALSFVVNAGIDSLVRHLSRLVLIDPETGISGRWKTDDYLRSRISRAEKKQESLSVIGVRILNEHRLNAMLGAQKTDLIIKEFVLRLTKVHEKEAFHGRWSDTLFFTILNTDDFLEVEPLCRDLLKNLSAPIECCERSVSILCNLMITRYPEDGADADELVSNIMSLQDKGTYLPSELLFFKVEDLQKERYQYHLTESLLRADFDSEMSLHFQPKMNLETGLCSGAEVLLRWTHPDLGSISPSEFIPLAEESGLVRNLTRWIIKTTFLYLRSDEYRKRDPNRTLVHAINLSVHDLRDEDLIPFIVRETSASNFEPSSFEFEITEGILVDDSPWIKMNLLHLMELGFGLAIDDFGTGYSSLSYLHRLKVNNLKIDQSFIASLVTDPLGTPNPVVDAIISMAHSLHLDITAEGVETTSQADYLKNKGCDYIQGWLFSKSLPFDEYLSFIENKF